MEGEGGWTTSAPTTTVVKKIIDKAVWLSLLSHVYCVSYCLR